MRRKISSLSGQGHDGIKPPESDTGRREVLIILGGKIKCFGRSKTMIRASIIAMAAVAFICPQLFADQVVLKNGDRLTGTIVDSDGKMLTLKSTFAGEVKIQWDAVQEITSDKPVYISTKGGETLVGKVTTTDGKFIVQTAISGPVTVAKDVVQSVRSKEQQEVYDAETERLRHPRLLDSWGGVVDTGLAIARGNTETLTYNLSAKAARTTARDKISVYGLSLYSRNSVMGTAVTTASLVNGGTRYDFNISDRYFAFGQLDLLHDRFQQLDLRVAPAGGVGIHAIKTPNTTLDLSAGGGLNKEFFTSGLSRTSGEVLLGEAYSRKFSEVTTLNQSLQFFPNLTDTGEFRSVFNLGLVTQLTKLLSWQVTFTNLYLSNPPVGVKTTDAILTTGLRFTFGKSL
jgi:putative salt-induced outer membrane protein YdiY/small nuclear ribonucleoprotein (snRNP)-like protein